MDQQTQEELAAEQAATQTPKEEEIRAEIIEEFGFDAEADVEKIDKLVKKELDQRGRFSKVIGQKIKHREEAEKLRKDLDAKKESEAPKEGDLTSEDILAFVDAKVPEEDRKEVIRMAKILNKKVSEALKDNVVIAFLADRLEVRTSADVSNTKKVPPAPVKSGTEKVLEDAMKNDKLPEPGSKEAEDLFWAKKGMKKPQ